MRSGFCLGNITSPLGQSNMGCAPIFKLNISTCPGLSDAVTFEDEVILKIVDVHSTSSILDY